MQRLAENNRKQDYVARKGQALTVVTTAVREETRPSGSNGACEHHTGALGGGTHLPGLQVLHSGTRSNVISLPDKSPDLKAKIESICKGKEGTFTAIRLK